MEKIIDNLNFEEFLKCKEWSLDTAISLINGKKPNCPNNIEYKHLGKKILVTNKDKLSYKKAIESISNNTLKAVARNYELIGSVKVFYELEMYFVKPRDFIEWCTVDTIESYNIEWRHKNQNNVVPELLQYFNYQYWINRKYWNFDETIMILLSTESPFPHEIANVFEIDEKYQEFSNSIMKEIIGEKFGILDSKYNKIEQFNSKNHNIRECFFKQKDFLVKLKDEIDFLKAYPIMSNNLCINSKIIDDYATRLVTEYGTFASKIKMLLSEDGENFYNSMVYGSHFSLPLIDDIISLSSALDLISGIERRYIKREEQEDFKSYFIDWLNRRYDNRARYQTFFKRDYDNNQINFLTDEKYEDGVLSGILRFEDLINWANGRNISIPPELENKSSTPTISTTKLPEYTTPYMQLMFDAIQHFNITKDNQPEVKNLKSYFETELREIKEDPNRGSPSNKAKVMATLLRLPEKQKGGNTKYKK